MSGAEKSGEQNKLVVEVMLEEFRALRSEILHAIRMQNAVFGVGGSLVAVAQSLAQNAGQGEALHFVVLALPPFAYLTLSLWLVEMARMMRAGNYLRFLEYEINLRIKDTGLLWETWLRSQKTGFFDPHSIQRWAQRVIVTLIFAIAIGGIYTIAVSQQDFVIHRYYFVVLYGLLGLILFIFGWPIVLIKRMGPSEYTTGQSHILEEYKRWRSAYCAELKL